MNRTESAHESNETTNHAFNNVMNILDEEGLIAQMLFPLKDDSKSTQFKNHQQWKQWTRYQPNHIDDFPQISIQEDRKFLFEEKHSYMWYKNINLPTITVSVQTEQFQGGRYSIVIDCFGVQIPENQLLQSPSSSQKEYPNTSFIGEYKRFSLEGEGQQQTILSQKQKIIFQRIKCKETSYNNKEGYASLFFEMQSQIYNQLQKKFPQNNSTQNNDISDKIIKLTNSSNNSSLFPLLVLVVNYESLPSQDKKSQKKIYQKIHHFVKPLIGSVLQVYFEVKDIPHCMKEVLYNEKMKEDYKQIYLKLTELKVQRAQMLGPSNTQYSNPIRQKEDQSSSDSENDDNSFSNEYNNNQVHPKISENRNSIQTQELRQKNLKKQKAMIIINTEEKLLKKRDYSSLQVQKRCNVQQRSDENNQEIEDEEDIEMENQTLPSKQPYERMYNNSKQSGEMKTKQSSHQNGSVIYIQQPKKQQHLNSINTPNSLSSNDDCQYLQEEEEKPIVQSRTEISPQNHKMVTLSKIPEMQSLNNNKESSTTNPTPFASFPEHGSFTSIYPDSHSHIPIHYVHQAYQMPQGMAMPHQNMYQQPMFIQMNPYMQQQPNPTNVTVSPAPAAVQVIMNPYQYQNMYYPYPGYQIPIPQQHPMMAANYGATPFIQPTYINYPNSSQAIPIQPNLSYYQIKTSETAQQEQQQKQPQQQQLLQSEQQ